MGAASASSAPATGRSGRLAGPRAFIRGRVVYAINSDGSGCAGSAAATLTFVVAERHSDRGQARLREAFPDGGIREAFQEEEGNLGMEPHDGSGGRQIWPRPGFCVMAIPWRPARAAHPVEADAAARRGDSSPFVLLNPFQGLRASGRRVPG